MPLTLTPVTAPSNTKVVCRETLFCSETLPCGEIGLDLVDISAGSLTIAAASSGSLTITPSTPQMPYDPTTWVDGVTTLGPTNLNHIEQGIDAATDTADGAVPKSLVDAKGDSLVGTAADTLGRLAVGANDTVLVADSAQTTGQKWAKITNAMVDTSAAIDVSKLAGAFSTYAPAWTATGVAPAIGNGSLTGRYLQIGKLVYVTINLVAGGTTTFGTGQWILSLPVTQGSARIPIADVLYFDSSAGQFFPGTTWDASSTTVGLYNTASPLTAVTGTVPFAWATSDQVILSLVYEAA